jgi:ABC-type nickel/cobalt efflux system permease component RcnA
MHEALHIFWHALKHSLIILPFLFLVYVLIEVIEMYTFSNKRTKHLLQGKYSPLIASAVGLVPQCGFSVAATDLYAKKYINMGTLLAVFIATSDEALPIMMGNLESAKMLPWMLLIKFIFALIVGYSFYLVQKVVDKKKGVYANVDDVEHEQNANEEHEHNKENEHHEHHDDEEEDVSVGCCGHHLDEQPTKLQKFLWHPLTHSLKIFAFIFIVNLVMEVILHFVGADKLAVVLGVNTYWQPLVSALVGLIPNCASSVVITQLYVSNALSFGACIAGLTANAGVAYVVLFRKNKNIKQNLIILASMYTISVVIGFITMLIF